jgi:DNA-binding transcriptional LysR family regulator
MDRLETRELAYFVAVAEACHFGQAARSLGIAQPPLSRAISRLERRLGVSLLQRTTRRVSLTRAGEELLHEARRALEVIDAAAARTRRAAAPRLALVLKPGTDAGLLPAILQAYRRQPDAVEVDVRTCGAGEQPELLRRGVADVAFVPALAELAGQPERMEGLAHEVLMDASGQPGPVRLLVAWAADRRSPALAAFVRTATAVATLLSTG